MRGAQERLVLAICTRGTSPAGTGSCSAPFRFCLCLKSPLACRQAPVTWSFTHCNKDYLCFCACLCLGKSSQPYCGVSLQEALSWQRLATHNTRAISGVVWKYGIFVGHQGNFREVMEVIFLTCPLGNWGVPLLCTGHCHSSVYKQSQFQ